MDLSGASRRSVLAVLGAAGTGALAGCTGDARWQSQTPANGSSSDGDGGSTGSSNRPSADVYVDPEGSDDGGGSAEAPLATIGEAFGRAEPGDTIYANPGEYQESIQVGEGGTADAPIELTGPADAVLRRPPDEPAVALIGGDHVHVTGLTITGVSDPSRTDDHEAYADAPLVLVTGTSYDSYNQGAVIAPHRIGYSGAQLVKFRLCRDAEAGPFRVVGRAGAAWQLTGSGHPSGEIVYVGTSPSTIENHPDLDGWDNTRNVRVHHVDNSDGHPHGQLVDVKPGTENVTVEYCTDGGGSHNNKDWAARSIAIRGHAATVRWNRLQDGEDVGIGLGSNHNNDPENELQERAGEENEIYGNEITGFGDESIWFPWANDGPGQAPEDQAILCGNTVSGEAPEGATAACPDSVPTGDGIGHTGGDSPWGN